MIETPQVHPQFTPFLFLKQLPVRLTSKQGCNLVQGVCCVAIAR